MKSVHLVPKSTFTFKPVVLKHKNETFKPLTKILYAVAHKNEEGEWKAYINTKGIPNYDETTILPFSEQSFELKGRTEVFRVNKDEKGYWVKVIRTEDESKFFPGNPQSFCTLCEGCVFSGYIIKVDGVKYFDMSVYQGTFKQCEELMSMTNKIKKDEE